MEAPMTLYGMRIVVEPLRQRYMLPDDVPPPTGMSREEFAAWSREVCGYCEPLLADNEVISNAFDNTLTMNHRTWLRVREELAKKTDRIA